MYYLIYLFSSFPSLKAKKAGIKAVSNAIDIWFIVISIIVK